MNHSSTLIVVAAVVIENGKVLVTKRPAHSHLGGMWEFPGGKVEPGEDPRRGLERELAEELGIEAVAGQVLEVTFHPYAERNVLLLFFAASIVTTSPRPQCLEVAGLEWCDADGLDRLDFPPGDAAILSVVKAMLSV